MILTQFLEIRLHQLYLGIGRKVMEGNSSSDAG